MKKRIFWSGLLMAVFLVTGIAQVGAQTAAFSASPTSGQTSAQSRLVVNFTDESTGDVTAWLWDFGDTRSNSSTSQNPSHDYRSAGDFTVTLTVNPEQATENTVVMTDPIHVMTGADFRTRTPTEGITPLTVRFDERCSDDVDTWHWYFGDGEEITVFVDDELNHTYVSPGKYTVTLECSGPIGSDTETKDDYHQRIYRK